MTSLDEVIQVLNNHPALGLFGFGTLPPTLDENFLKQVNASRKWLTETPGADIIIKRGSYAVKHMIETDVGYYIPNGAAITAAILEGFDAVRKRPDGPNCYFTRRT